MIKRITIIISFIILLAVNPNKAQKIAAADGVAECVIETTTNKIVHAKNEDQKLPMASTTKIMTALIICEDCNLSEIITIPNEAVGVEGSSIYLKKDEIIDVRDLLYGLMLRSGNDCAVALAIYHSGSVEEFVKVMNNRAIEMNLSATCFKNPNGLPAEGHFTTAKELAIISCEALKNNIFKEIVSCKEYHGNFRSYTNKNKILNTVEGANGIKTGYTVKAGRCLVSSAKRNGVELVCVVLNCPDMFERSKSLLDTNLESYRLITLDEGQLYVYKGRIYKNKDKNIFLVYFQSTMRCIIEDIPNKKAILRIYDKNELLFEGILDSIIDD